MDFIVEGQRLFAAGGPIMYLLVLGSLFIAVIASERYLFLKSSLKGSDILVAELTSAFREHDLNEALISCEKRPGIIADVAQCGIECLQQNQKNIETVLAGEMSLAASRMSENLNHLSMMVTAAPLLGLLGTVVGMIGSFSVLDLKNGQPLAITGGIGEALIATATGLCVAILALGCYSYLEHRVDKAVNSLEEVCLLCLREAGR